MEGARWRSQTSGQGHQLSSAMSMGGALTPSPEEEMYTREQLWSLLPHEAELPSRPLYAEALADTSPHPSVSSTPGSDLRYSSYTTPVYTDDSSVLYQHTLEDSQVPDQFAQQLVSQSSALASYATRSTSSSYHQSLNLDPRSQQGFHMNQTVSQPRSRPAPLDIADNIPGTSSKNRNRTGGAKPPGACARCRKLKMKCTFNHPDAEVCSRCDTGGHECVFPGRKPRSPGMRTVLRQQIREKDAMIDVLLNQVNPGPTMATPLMLVPSRLSLTASERAAHHDVLNWLEKATQSSGKSTAELSKKFEIASLEDNSDEFDSEDDDDAETQARPRSSPSSSRQIQTVLEELTPAGLLATASLQRITANPPSASNSDGSSSKGTNVTEVGPASESYFLPGPAANLELRRLIVERQAAPDILLSGLLTPEDVTKLFQIHYQWINPLMSFLDENIHTPAAVLGRSPFLFTVVCAIASRYYDEKPEIHGMAMHFAKAAAANAIIDGWKTIEMCQAFALLSVYNPPARRWEEDRGWCFTGIAFRLATELNLSRPPKGKPADEREEREVLNQTRAWITCFIMDRCMSIHLGKPWMIPEDQTIRNASTWCSSSKYQNRGDLYLACLVDLLRIMSSFVSTVNPAFELSSRPTRAVDYVTVQKIYDDELRAWRSRFEARYETDDGKDVAITMQRTLIKSVYHYTRLVSFSYGLQQISRKGAIKECDVCFMGCLQTASAVIKVMIEDFVPTGFIRYVPELVFAQTAFASAVLLKCLRPEFKELLDRGQEERIVRLIKRLHDTWTSDNIATDDIHTSKLYARLIKVLLEPHLVRLQQAASTQYDAELNSPSDASTSPTSSLPEVSPYTQTEHMPLSPNIDTKPVQFEAGMGQEFTQSWEGMYNQTSLQDALAAPLPGDAFGMSDAEYMSTVMLLANETWLI